MLSETQVIFRLACSVILGGFIGLERQVHRRSAGLRTHILVCLGSCLIMLTSIYLFDIYKTQATVDPGRIAAGVITGIGFLGAGAIIRERTEVKGLTTAASLWVVAAIGMALGCGFYNAALYSVIFTLVALFFFRRIEAKMFGKEEKKENGGER